MYIENLVTFGLAMLCRSGSELRSEGWRSPELQSKWTKIKTLSPLWRFDKARHIVPTVGMRALGKVLIRLSKVMHKTHGPIDDHWVKLLTSKAFYYFLSRQDDIQGTFNHPQIVLKITVERMDYRFLLTRYCKKFCVACDICNLVSTVLKRFADF